MSNDVQTIDLQASDGGTYHGRLTLPEGASADAPVPAVLLVHELFGLSDYIEEVGERLADLGYASLAPDLFWRIDPDNPLDHSEESMGIAFGRLETFDFELAGADAVAALGQLGARPDVAGRPAVLGFCLGGILAFAVGIHGEPSAVVSYYGATVADLLPYANGLRCPALFVFGTEDPFIPNEVADAVEATFAGRDDVEVHRFAAGHAFDNPHSGEHSDAGAKSAAWEVASAFLARHINA